jgi:hypothetical protein
MAGLKSIDFQLVQMNFFLKLNKKSTAFDQKQAQCGFQII